MKTEKLELVELSETELCQIEGGSHLKDFVEGIACGLGAAAFAIAAMAL